MIEPIILPSGAELRISLAPFTASKNLYQALLEELKSLDVGTDTEIDFSLLKNLVCAGFSSKKIEVALEECLKKCLYNGFKITRDTFEDVEARQDYFIVCFEVAKANIEPFLKALMPKLSQVTSMLQKSQA